jgi:glucose/arabinose dehydrogenase
MRNPSRFSPIGNTGKMLFVITIPCFLSILICENIAFAAPTVFDSSLQVETVTAGLRKPTSMAFLGPDDILVVEQEKGTVQRIKNGVYLTEPVLNVNVNASIYRGLLGIDIAKVSPSIYYLFIYFTEAESSTNKTAIGNRLYRYTFVDDPSSGAAQAKIVDSKLLLDLPAEPGPSHNGGRVLIGPDGAVNLIVGDLDKREGKAQNFENGTDLDGTGGVLRVTQDGGRVGDGIFGSTHPADKYVAYGIRNSFGMDYDPLTGMLWITDNGISSNDEINLAEIGFNGGWKQIMGMAPTGFNFTNLVSFGGKGNYSDPEFVWSGSVAPAALEFLDSTMLGKDYQYDMFVGDVNWGRIYKFDLDSERTGLLLEGNLSDKVHLFGEDSIKPHLFGEGFNGVTDLKTGPGDGYLYVLSHYGGAIYKIVPKLNTTKN